MKTKRINIGDRVEKTGSIKDHTVGRQGEIIEMDYELERARVCWDASPAYQSTGSNADLTGEVIPMKPIRTWVNFRYLSDPLIRA